jgi:hypothetical protein
VHVWVAPVDGAAGDQRAAHALLTELAGELIGGPAVLRHDAAGRPWVDPLWVSVSHGRGSVAVAASAGGPVGVDLESRRSFETHGLATRWFDPVEIAWLDNRADPLEGFLRLWTAKEAVGKALGTGLRGSGLRRRMPLEFGASGAVVPGIEPGLAVLHPPIGADAVLAVAVPVAASEVLVCEYPACHGAALRSTVASRTSFPVVVRGN